MDRHPSQSASRQAVITWGNNHDNLVESRSYYRCSFCKRGFSNAQALGGHMNIHRRDRAKLKEFSCENLLSLDATRICPDCEDHDDPPSKEKLAGLEIGAGHDHAKKDHKSENELVLFGHHSSSGDHRKVAQENRKDQIIRYGHELDLELRLGPDQTHRHDAKSNSY